MVKQGETHGLFPWRNFDVRSKLPSDWQGKITRLASMAVDHQLRPTSVTSREKDRTTPLTISTVGGVLIAQELPWLYDLYHGLFRDLAQFSEPEPVAAAENTRRGININVQRGDHKRGNECHVDTNPIAALLYVTSHPEGTGGELVIANSGNVFSRKEVDANASRIYPVAGQLTVFDGREHSHYVRALTDPDPNNLRLVVAMNYYKPSCPETNRPAGLDQHLGLGA